MPAPACQAGCPGKFTTRRTDWVAVGKADSGPELGARRHWVRLLTEASTAVDGSGRGGGGGEIGVRW